MPQLSSEASMKLIPKQGKNGIKSIVHWYLQRPKVLKIKNKN